MEYSSIRFIEQQVQHIQFAEKQLSVLNPKSVLARGYAIVRHNGKAIQDEKELESGNQIDVQFNEGCKQATII
jgi:exodeoxyribonuclease VII large subunit